MIETWKDLKNKTYDKEMEEKNDWRFEANTIDNMYEEMVLEIDYHLMSYLFRSHFDMWAEAFEINFT